VSISLSLLASYSTLVSATLNQSIRGLEGDISQTSSPGRVLKVRRNQLLFKEIGLLASLRQISKMIPWEIGMGGRFPEASYAALVDEIQK
jgi:hypothetical protein